MALSPDKLRIEAIKKELEEHSKQSDPVTERIEFRGKYTNFPVVRINTEYVLLNPKNNRLAAQLIDHPKRFNIDSDPTSVESQTLLSELLEKTVEFGNLKQQLSEMNQVKPGLITREGVLVNGNTRVAALRRLGINHVDVAVLNDNVTETDILELEMTLQMTKLVHQDYSFANELLLMKRFLENGGTEDQLAKKMAWTRGGVRKVQLHMRMLQYVEDVRNLCKPKLPYAVFDTKKQHLKDLDDDYQSLKNSGDISGAESLKWTRLTAMFLGLNKDQVRTINADFVEEHLIPRIGDKLNDMQEIFVPLNLQSNDDGLNDLFGNEDFPKYYDMKKFLTNYLSKEENRDDSGEPVIDILSNHYDVISFNARRSADQIIDDQKLESAQADPGEILKDMRVKLSGLHQNMSKVINSQNFKLTNFKFDLDKIKEEIDRIELSLKPDMPSSE